MNFTEEDPNDIVTLLILSLFMVGCIYIFVRLFCMETPQQRRERQFKELALTKSLLQEFRIPHDPEDRVAAHYQRENLADRLHQQQRRNRNNNVNYAQEFHDPYNQQTAAKCCYLCCGRQATYAAAAENGAIIEA